MRRHRAVPAIVANPLFGRGAVHGLDGDAHHARKQLFLTCLDAPGVEALATEVDRCWSARTRTWAGSGPVPVFSEAVAALGQAVLGWAGVDPALVGPRASEDLVMMVDGFGSPQPWQGLRRRRARRRAEQWASAAVSAARADRPPPEKERPIDVVARWRDADGGLLDERTAAVELLNLVRPTVAVAWFVAFSALALAEHPEVRPGLRSEGGDPARRTAFAHEVRRVYPFVPVLAARARCRLTHEGHTLPAGHRLILDVYGTNHLQERWPDPDAFRPERFLDRRPTAYDFVPQGGGEPTQGHRCPGEPVTIHVIAA